MPQLAQTEQICLVVGEVGGGDALAPLSLPPTTTVDGTDTNDDDDDDDGDGRC